MDENLILGFTVTDSYEFDASKVYDELENILPNAEIKRFDKIETNSIRAGAIDVIAVLDAIDSLSLLVEIGRAIYWVYKKMIHPYKSKNENLGLNVSVGRENEIHFTLDDYRDEKGFIDDFVIKVVEYNKTTKNRDVRKSKEVHVSRKFKRP
ncbi:hypothetical protein [Methanosarcina mazei]|uniref:Uncharacterized protein n=1 Tax=Methanosarcina mazei TaxID=2209 RepID=A0A0F8M7B2_METMZ|nr:hypothetical protein [Methanosarcina mazei]KKH17770.1 hypothetical protein DU44_00175 [Methanosarcina mazei]KKH19994.1 hypothetical protein DU48_01290 [Methanosarcina mazei]KKH24440.1 hypothetical protein DU65_02980 [Methanosarcina mazei]